MASNVVQAALNDATQSSTRKYELLRAAFMPFLKALDPVTAARLLLDVIMSKRNKQSTAKAKKSKKSNVAPQLSHARLHNLLTKNEQQNPSSNPSSQDQVQALTHTPAPTTVAAVGTPEPKSPTLVGDIEMPTIFSQCARCHSCISYSDRFCSECGKKVNSTAETPATYINNDQTAMTTSTTSSSNNGNTADPFEDVPLGIASSFF